MQGDGRACNSDVWSAVLIGQGPVVRVHAGRSTLTKPWTLTLRLVPDLQPVTAAVA